MPYGGGGSIVIMPVSPVPASVEIRSNRLAASNTNPFTAQQQIQDWGVDLFECSFSYASLTKAQAAVMIAFLKSLQGMVNVFQANDYLATQYPESFTTDGSTKRTWRLKDNQIHWTINPGSVYKSVTFEAREAL